MKTVAINALLHEVRNASEDFELRLKLADALQAEGQPAWAEIVRRQCQRAGQFAELRKLIPTIDLQFCSQRERELVIELREQLGLNEEYHDFFLDCDRGLFSIDMPVDVAARPDRLPANFLMLLNSGWVDRLCLLCEDKDVQNLADALQAPFLSQIAELDIRGYCGPEGARHIANATQLERLKVLHMTHHTELGDSGAEQLAAAPHLSGLEELHLLDGCRVLGAGAAAIAASKHLKKLNRFSLWNTDLTGEDCQEFFSNLRLPSLRAINLGFLGDDGAASLAASPASGQLTELGFTSSMTSTASVEALTSSRHLQHLTCLTIHTAPEARSTESMLRTVVQSPLWKQLEVFELLTDEISVADMQALAAQPNSALRSLTFGCNKTLTSVAARPLVEFVNRSRLKLLDLSEAFCDEEASMALMTGLRSESLLSLDAWVSRDIVEESIPALAQSDGLPNLMAMSLFTSVTVPSLAPLVFSPHFRSLAWLRTPLGLLGHYGDDLEGWRSRLQPFNFSTNLPPARQAEFLLLAREQDEQRIREAGLLEAANLVQTTLDLEAVPALEAWLLDSVDVHVSVPVALKSGLKRLATRDVEQVWSKLSTWSESARSRSIDCRTALIQLNSRVIADLMKENEVLAERREETVSRTVRLLERDLNDMHPEIARSAVSGLQQICDVASGADVFRDPRPYPPEVEVRLARLMNSIHPSVRTQVAFGFSSRPVSPDNLHPLLGLLEDHQTEIISEAFNALQSTALPPEAERILVLLTDDPDRNLQLQAIRAMRSLTSVSPATLTRLEKLLERDDRELFDAVVETLEQEHQYPRALLHGLLRWGIELARSPSPDSGRDSFVMLVQRIARNTRWPELVPLLVNSLTLPIPFLSRTSAEILSRQYADDPQLPELVAEQLCSMSETVVREILKNLIVKQPALIDGILQRLGQSQSPESQNIEGWARRVLETIRNPAQNPELLSLMQAGDKIAAIKRYRDIVGCGLAEAKQAIEAHLDQMI